MKHNFAAHLLKSIESSRLGTYNVQHTMQCNTPQNVDIIHCIALQSDAQIHMYMWHMQVDAFLKLYVQAISQGTSIFFSFEGFKILSI